MEASTSNGSDDVKTFRGRSLEELLPQIRAELGPDAIVLRRREGLGGGVGGFFQRPYVEVDARAPQSGERPLEIRSDRATVEGLSSPAVQALFEQATPFADALAAAARDDAHRGGHVLGRDVRRRADRQPAGRAVPARPRSSCPTTNRSPSRRPGLYGPQPNAAAIARREAGAGADWQPPASEPRPPRRAATAAPPRRQPAAAAAAPQRAGTPPAAAGTSGDARRPGRRPPAPRDAEPASRRGARHSTFRRRPPSRSRPRPRPASRPRPEAGRRRRRATARHRRAEPGAGGRRRRRGRHPRAPVLGAAQHQEADPRRARAAHPRARPARPGPRTIAFIGSGGAGKSSAVAHLAAAYVQAGADVAVISLRGDGTLANRLHPLGIGVISADDAAQAKQRLGARKPLITLIDTPAAGASTTAADVKRLATDLQALKPSEVHLALPATLSSAAAAEVAAALASLGPTHIALTHTDETARPARRSSWR